MSVTVRLDAGFIVIEDSLGREVYYCQVDELRTLRGMLDFCRSIGACRWITVDVYRAVFAIVGAIIDKEGK